MRTPATVLFAILCAVPAVAGFPRKAAKRSPRGSKKEAQRSISGLHWRCCHVDAAEIEAQWTTIKQAIQQKWAVLGGEELDQARMSAGRLVGVIQQRTGDPREDIEAYLEQTVRGQLWAAQRAAEQSIEQHPIGSVFVALAAGFAAGALIVSACCRSR